MNIWRYADHRAFNSLVSTNGHRSRRCCAGFEARPDLLSRRGAGGWPSRPAALGPGEDSHALAKLLSVLAFLLSAKFCTRNSTHMVLANGERSEERRVGKSEIRWRR